MPDSDRFIVVTGGPGTSKTTLIAALAATGSAYPSAFITRAQNPS